jgi:hypothetical protein
MTEMNEQQVNKPWPLIVMVSMLAIVILAGLLLRPRTDEQKLQWLSLLGTTNHGELMNPPLAVDTNLFRDAKGAPWTALDDTNWKLLVVNNGVCAVECEEMIYLARQVHSRLNRRAPYLDRALLNFGDSGLNMEQLTGYYPDLQIVDADYSAYRTWIAGSNLEAQDQVVILLINPIDVVQMFYTSSHEGNGLLGDLEHLMKLAN